MSNSELYSTSEAAEATGGDYADLLDYARDAGLPQVGTAYVWTDNDIDSYLAECAVDDDEDDVEDEDDIENEDGEDDLDDGEDDDDE